jgi:hypothetical protein
MIAASLRALLTRVIDYAGLFPPASLSLDESIRNHARYLNEPESWMLGRFICPAAKLADLIPYLNELFTEQTALPLSVLGRAGPGESYKADFLDMAKFRDECGERANIDAYETKMESRLPGRSEDVFVEFPWDKIEIGARMTGVGFKLRTGGTEANAFPPIQIVAHAIAECRDVSKHMKFTAGLHHPIRHFNSSVNTKMHGFVNVFVAGTLAHAIDLSEAQLIPILNDEDPTSFRFDDDGLRYKEYRATTRQIEDARRQLVISFGSCSFDEPRDDLRSLGWL